MNLSNKRIAVTGGAGFIGSHLVDALIERGAWVVVMDNLSRGHLDNVNPGAIVETIDLSRITPDFKRFDVVYHLAAKVTGIEYNRTHQLDMLQSNLAINYHVTQALAKRGKKCTAVLASTACVYPHDAPIPTPESAADVCDPEPTNFGYGAAKWLLEKQGKFLAQEYGVNVIVTRFSNNFGLRDYYDKTTSHVAPKFIRRIMDGENPFTLNSSGKQTRVLVDARETAEALCRLVETGTDDMSGYDVFNVGHSRQISVQELARTILDVAGYQNRKIDFDTHIQLPEGYPARQSDTTKFEARTGYRLGEISIENTIQDMLLDYERQKKLGWIY